ncbi:MAG: carboxypeptidase M32, partial [Alphaproteobacteria bacterium]|nr:carboxypeptidase M32 [Alphaproteobacteria bacterium]
MNAPSRPHWDAATARFGRIAALDDAIGLIAWDQRTMMPEGSAESRAELMATLEVMRHELLTDPALADHVAGTAAEV